MKVNIIKDCEEFKHFFDELNKISSDIELFKRNRKLNANNLIETIIRTVFEYEQPSLENYCTVFETITGIPLSRQSFDERITFKMIEYLKCLLGEVMKSSNDIPNMIKKYPKLIEMFVRIYVLDSTAIELNENFVKVFRGSGGCASKSALKIQHLYEGVANISKYVEITSGVLPDNKYVLNNIDILDKMEKGSLFIADLGYFSADFFEEVDKHGLFYISRLPVGEINIYSTKITDEKIDFVKLLKDNQRNIIDIDVLITDKKLSCRLVIVPLPEEIANKRVQKKNEDYKRKGKTPSEYSKIVCRYTMIITNVSADILPAKDLYKIYTVRWSVELSFKVWKSKFHIDIIEAKTNINRVLFDLYGKLLCIFIMYNLLMFHKGRVFCLGYISMYKAYPIIKLIIAELISALSKDDNSIEKIMQMHYSLLERKCKLTKTKKRKSTIEKLCTYSKGGYQIAKNIEL